MSLYSRLDRIAADVEKLNKQVTAVSNAPQSQRTSVEGGSIDFNDADGNLKAIVGEQEDGGNTVNVVAGPTPPTPTNFTVTVDHGSLTVHWDGDFEDGAVAPSDWARWTAYAQAGQFVVPDRTTSIGGTDSASGGEVTAGVLKGEWTVTLLAWSQAGKPSAMAEPVTVDVPGYGDIVLAEIDAAETVIRNAGEVLVSEQDTLNDKLSDAFGQIEDAITSANGKNVVHYEDRAPTVDDAGVEGDTWFVVNLVDGWKIVAQYRNDGSAWLPVELSHEVLASLDLGSLVAGSAAIKEAVVQKLWAEVVVTKMAVAEQFIGENAILTGAVTAQKITASEELWAKIAEFVKIRAEHIEADAIDGMVITGPNIRTSASGARVQMDPGGVRVFNADNDVRTHLSPDGSAFKGEVEAETLVVNQGAEFKGSNTLSKGAKFTLAAGVTDPTAPPVVQPYWNGLEFTSANINGSNPVGLAWDGTNYITVGANRAVTGVASYFTGVYAMKINGETGEATRLRCDFSAASETESRVSEVFGVTCIGSELFFLGRYSYLGFVWVTDLDGVFKRRFDSPSIGYSATNPLTYRPGIGNDGTNLVIAQVSDDGPLGVNTVNKTTGAVISFVRNTSDTTKSDITGVYVGNADWGRKLVTVMKSANAKLPSFSATTGTYDGATTQFDAASPDSTGVVFVDGKFRTLDPSGVIHEYAGTNTGDGSGDWWATYYWYTDVDNDNVIGSSDYRSRMAPPARFRWPRRAMLKVLGQPMPTGVDALGPALAKKTTKPTREDFHGPGWVPDRGKPYAWYTDLPDNWTTFASPSDTNTYPESESSVLESASGTFRVLGDGSGRWGPLKMGRNGVMSGLIATGEVVVAVDTGGTAKKFTINLPPGRFTKPPVVWAQASTGYPQLVSVGVPVGEITSTTFGLYFYRANTTATRVSWFAMDSE